MSEYPNPTEARDERLLRLARRARADDDAAAEREAIARLLEPYWVWARTIAYGRIEGVDDPGTDAEEIAQELMGRLVLMLARKLEFDSPFRAVASVNLDYAIKDYWRRSGRARSRAVDPEELAEVEDQPGAPGEGENIDLLRPYFAGLNERERRLAHDRFVLDLSPSEIAARHGMKRGAVDTAMSRILKKMREKVQQT
ncbi:MAG TPA: sigma-70 family RNA polymerase sigma factor [Solirubrobacterales bacterium]|nr:sigma-70 family RNA polymerase sigma factor [Solirubrobacterales bacterium]